jgi:UDP-2-acetamido-3-amino-2,3-dideoxy-glucuronate N-acetyltransferase
VPNHIHPTAEVSPEAVIGEGSSIWHHCQVRQGTTIGSNCILGKGVFVDVGVSIGNNVKVQNYVSIYHGVTIEDGVFIGPHVCFTNDLNPRAINADGSLKDADDWVLSKTLVHKGASIGANATIRCGVTVGEWALVGAGSVVTHDIPDHALVYGNPAKLHGFVCACGEKLGKQTDKDGSVQARCPVCGQSVEIDSAIWEKIT